MNNNIAFIPHADTFYRRVLQTLATYLSFNYDWLLVVMWFNSDARDMLIRRVWNEVKYLQHFY